MKTKKEQEDAILGAIKGMDDIDLGFLLEHCRDKGGYTLTQGAIDLLTEFAHARLDELEITLPPREC